MIETCRVCLFVQCNLRFKTFNLNFSKSTSQPKISFENYASPPRKQFFSICVLFINSRKQTNPFSILGSPSRKQHCTERKLSKTHINARCYARKIFNFSLILTFIVFMHMNVFRKCIKIETRNKFYSFSNLRKSNKYFAFIHRLEKIPRLFISDFFLNQII